MDKYQITLNYFVNPSSLIMLKGIYLESQFAYVFHLQNLGVTKP